MTGGLSQFVRCIASVAEDTPIADRFHATLEASEAFMAECDRVRAQHQLDMVARWGLDEAHFVSGPSNPTLRGDM